MSIAEKILARAVRGDSPAIFRFIEHMGMWVLNWGGYVAHYPTLAECLDQLALYILDTKGPLP